MDAGALITGAFPGRLHRFQAGVPTRPVMRHGPSRRTVAWALLGSAAVHAALLLPGRASQRAPQPPALAASIVHVRLASHAAVNVERRETLPSPVSAARVAPRAAAKGAVMHAVSSDSEIRVGDSRAATVAQVIAPVYSAVEAPVAPAASPLAGAVPELRVTAAPSSLPVMFLGVPEPDYPQSAREEGEEGLVVLRVRVSKEGRPLEVAIRASSGVRALDAAAIAGVKRWTFRPARVGQYDIEAWIDVPIRFRLK